MHLIFEHGDRDAPAGHALIYFTDDTGNVFATYVGVPPIPFDLTNFVPPMFAQMFQGMDLGSQSMVAAIPPIPQSVPDIEYLRALAERRRDDLVYAGATMRGDPMRMGADANEAAQAYEELYSLSAIPQPETEGAAPARVDSELSRFAEMSEREQLDELTTLTGRLRDSMRNGQTDSDTEQQLRQVASLLPAKYRSDALVEAVLTPGDRGQKLAALHLERSYKLYHEDYLDLERIDREIEAIAD